ncbi:MAG TPA: 30S ribosomal protein S12 methylthiotransferase RimO [Gemmatimonadaceae bacterium]|nr:30S ribosomal protein S12 methylthiotransferase RimO [Gemmatimonadaceae bacterium]
MKVGLVTLGCDKNTVDSERYLAELIAHGAVETADLTMADVIIVNTCGFIDAAKRESIDAIVGAGRYKSSGTCQAVVAVGCLVQRHKDELSAALPEVDLFLGAAEADRLVPELTERGLLGDPLVDHPGVRVYSGDLPHVRYLKISEGCDHGCAFCAIPLMRGKHRSFALADVVREAQLLELQGAREVNLVAQDLAHYGRDRRDGIGLPQLLQALIAETSIPWIRLLYLYSAGLTPALLELMAGEARILRYLDIPMQHASDAVLKRMRRPERQAVQRQRIRRIREVVPDVAIRTTCIVGFPGESEDDFQQLLDFLEETRFDRVGAFTYSAQEGTRAWQLPDDVPDDVKRERLERLTELQRVITAERYETHVGRESRVLVDRVDPASGVAQARTPWQADDVDGVTRFSGDVVPGDFADVVIDAVEDDYDFTASVMRVADRYRPPGRPAGTRRALPMATTVGSFGR